MKSIAIILSGGSGERMGLNIPKQYIIVNDIPIICYSINKFLKSPYIDRIVIVLHPCWKDFVKSFIAIEECDEKISFVEGGMSREHSVLNGLNAISGFVADDDIVFIHDSARPLFDEGLIEESIHALAEYDAVLPVIPSNDASYRSRDGCEMCDVIQREELFLGQSPEVFKYGPLMKAHSGKDDIYLSNIKGTSALAFQSGMRVRMLGGSFRNFKITTPSDLKSFEAIVNDTGTTQ